MHYKHPREGWWATPSEISPSIWREGLPQPWHPVSRLHYGGGMDQTEPLGWKVARGLAELSEEHLKYPTCGPQVERIRRDDSTGFLYVELVDGSTYCVATLGPLQALPPDSNLQVLG